MLLISLAIFILQSTSSSTNNNDEEYVEIYSYCDPTPNSDIHQDNALYYIKPTQNGPIIPAICSNGYTMIDPSLDINLQSLPSYLSSWDYSRLSLDWIMPNLDDTSTFRQWWIPSNQMTRFRVASQCNSCEPSSEPTMKNNVVYYTDSNNFCYTSFIAGNPCTQDINEEACNKCDEGIFEEDPDSDTTYWAKCSALQVSADLPSLHDPQGRVNHPLSYRPIMSMTRSACTCYQLATNKKPTKFIVPRSELPMVTLAKQLAQHDVRNVVDYIDELIVFDTDDNPEKVKEKQEANNGIDCNDNVHYLSQQDFLSGTYRIRECGEYIFTEDVECNFNAPTKAEMEKANFSPNSITGHRLYWYPTPEQVENEYDGLYNYTGTYSLGFFAGIAIECDDVVINLNGFSFGMDKRFYIQQRFFSLIELAAKPFLPWQGASTWGLTGVYYANNVEIKGPGQIGLTSHHGIHGNMATNINIHDINVKDFDVAGIACNGCQYVKIEDVVVGPQNKDIPTLGRYTHSRAFIPRLKDLNDNYGDEQIQFYGREMTTVSALCQRMVNQMDMIYHNYINGKEYDDDDKEWIAAQKIFKNPTGWMDGGSSYGIVINGGGAAVVGIGTRIAGTNNIFMDNVEVFGIYNQAVEKIKFSVPEGTSRGILFDVTDWIAVVDQIEDRSKTQYIGDVFTDIQFAVNKYIPSWYYRNSFYVGPEEEDFVFNGNTKENGYPFLTIFPMPSISEDDPDKIVYNVVGCGTDIQLHSSKGSIGMMISGAQDSEFQNIYIHDIYNWADLGMNHCGPYPGPHLTTEDIDIQYGYTGTRSHGMVIDWTTGDYKDIHIENVESWHGEANGLTIYKETYINLQNVLVRNINAGSKLSEDVVNGMDLPNLVPRACPVDIHADTEINYVNGEDVDNIIFNDVAGFEVCDQFGHIEDNGKKAVIEMNSMTIIVLVFVVVMILMIFYVLYRSVGCVKDVYVKDTSSEKTPLLQAI